MHARNIVNTTSVVLNSFNRLLNGCTLVALRGIKNVDDINFIIFTLRKNDLKKLRNKIEQLFAEISLHIIRNDSI